MSRRPWMKFYPADWQADQALGVCSLAARALWMEMLAIMHRADPYGHLLVNGKKPSDEQLAALARAPVDQVRALTHELEAAGVFSRTRNGTIYSRRMTTDEKKRKDGKKAQQIGTLPGSRRYRQAFVKQREKPTTPGVVDKVVERPPTHPEARYNNNPPTPRRRGDELAGEFEVWWQHVPRKVGKGQAERAYRAARKQATAEQLTSGIRRYAAAVVDREPRFIAHPATWLNGKRWLDEDGSPREARGAGPPGGDERPCFAGFKAAIRAGDRQMIATLQPLLDARRFDEADHVGRRYLEDHPA